MEIRDLLYVIYCVWVIGIVFPFRASFFPFTVPHALLSAVCGLVVGIMSVFSGMAMPIYLLPFFAIELIVFLLSRQFAWFENYSRCMGYMFRSSVVFFAALTNSIDYSIELLAIPFVIAGCFEGCYVIYQKLVDTGKLKNRFNYEIKRSRYVGSIGNPNQVSEFLLITMVVTLFVSFSYPLALIAAPFIISGLIYTAGRATLVSLAVGCLSVGIIYPLSLIVSIPVLVLAVWKMKDRLDWHNVRLFFWKHIFRNKLKHPFRIEGMNVIRFVDQLSNTELHKYTIFNPLDRSHNWFLDLFVEGGVLYFVTFLVASIASLFFLPSFLKVAMIMLLVNEFFSFPLHANYLLWAFLASVAVAGVALPLWVSVPFVVYGVYIGIRAYLAGKIVGKKPDSFMDAYYRLRKGLELSKAVSSYFIDFLWMEGETFGENVIYELPRMGKIDPLHSGDFWALSGLIMTHYGKDKDVARECVELGFQSDPGNIRLRRLERYLDGDEKAFVQELHKITREFMQAYGKDQKQEEIFWKELIMNSPAKERYEAEYCNRFGGIECKLKK